MPAAFSRTTRSLAADAPRGAWLAWALGGLLLVAWVAWALFSRVTVYEVSAKARLEVGQGARAVSTVLPARMRESRLVLGAPVRAGDVLAEMDATSETLQWREGQARLAAIGPQMDALKKEVAALERGSEQEDEAGAAALRSARSRIDEASAGTAYARDAERRLRAEAAAGGVAQADAQRALAELRKQQAAQEALAADLGRLRSQRRAQGHQQRAQIESLRRNLAALEGERGTLTSQLARLAADIDKHRIRAPIDGRIGDVLPLRAGDYVAAGQKLATVVPSSELIVVADFTPAAALGRIHAGQAARLRLDGFPWAQYGSIEATVSRVSSEIRDQQVRVEFTPQGGLPSGLATEHGWPGAIEVAVEQLAPARMVLRAAGQVLAPAASSKP